jgi:prepilin-type N-terminal cleavage/methylation domain-containing protein
VNRECIWNSCRWRASRAPLRGKRATYHLPVAAFTLIELLTVIAIIGILAAILVPTVGGARNAANRAKTRAQFSQWATAFEAFRQEYGAYPQLFANGAQKLVNQGATTQANGNHLFHDLLAGVHRDGSQLTGANTGTPTPALGQNPRRVRFMNFADSDFVTQLDVNAARATTAQLNFIRDAFFNTSIAVVTDSNLDGVINGRDATGGFPAVTAAGSTTTIRPTTIVPTGNTGGVHAGVIFYSAPPGATTENDLITSWR